MSDIVEQIENPDLRERARRLKSMTQMQAEMLAKARFDGGWPRVVHHFGGVLQLCHDQEEYERARRSVKVEILIALIGLIGIAVFAVSMLAMAALRHS